MQGLCIGRAWMDRYLGVRELVDFHGEQSDSDE